jgi:DNA-binding NarL/FixJ family response regulator/FtsZ-binding cell division protein ZapB
MNSVPITDRLMPRRPLQLMVVTANPTLRLGLRQELQPFADLRIVAEAKTTADALRGLIGWVQGSGIDLLLLDFDSELTPSAPFHPGLNFCQQLQARSPNLPILLLTSPTDAHLSTAFNLGIEGAWVKGRSMSDLITAIRRVAAGERYWVPEILPIATASVAPRQARSALAEISPPKGWQRMRQTVRRQGIEQIDAALMAIAQEVRSPHLSTFERWFLAGRQRELRTARWMVNTLLAIPQAEAPINLSTRSPDETTLWVEADPWGAAALEPDPEISPPRLPPTRGERAIVSRPAPALTPKTLQAQLFDQITAKLQGSLDNLTDIPLEIDLLKEGKKQQLFYAVLQQVEQLLDELRFSQIPPAALREKRSVMLQDLWQGVITLFFGKYYALPAQDQSVDVVAALLLERAAVQTEMLDSIPLVPELFGHLLFELPLMVDEVPCAIGTAPAIDRASALLENLVIQVACAVVQPLLNQFADHEQVKQTFYHRRLLSTREIERFRNDLSWKYRLNQYVSTPTAIFESRHWLWGFGDLGIQRRTIYTPRGHELEQLSGIQFAVTLVLETRDAIAPRLQTATSWLGRGIVYLLTEVIGRSIGLIGRGIAKGIGDAWQDRKKPRQG